MGKRDRRSVCHAQGTMKWALVVLFVALAASLPVREHDTVTLDAAASAIQAADAALKGEMPSVAVMVGESKDEGSEAEVKAEAKEANKAASDAKNTAKKAERDAAKAAK